MRGIVGAYPVFGGSGGAGSVATPAQMAGANVFDCTAIAGFSQRYNAVKTQARYSGTITKMSCYVFNVYGAVRKLSMAIYDYTGSRLAAGTVTLPVLQNQNIEITLSSAVPVTAGSQYWLAVWGDGVDIPYDTSFVPFGIVFPSQMHALKNAAVASIPLTLPGAGTTTSETIPISAY